MGNGCSSARVEDVVPNPHANRTARILAAKSIEVFPKGVKANGLHFAGVSHTTDSDDILPYIQANVVGNNQVIPGPFGHKLLTFADYVASGRLLTFFEENLQSKVYATYANTHSTSSFTGIQTTKFRADARLAIQKSVNATSEDLVMFCGAGSTEAINRTVHYVQSFRKSVTPISNSKFHDSVVVFTGPHEHHSNLLPWREMGATVVTIGEAVDGTVSVDDLAERLKEYSDYGMKIGSFSAASNVTGVRADVDSISELMHEHHGLAFFDYGAACPYVEIDMNPPTRPQAYKDAVFLSPHKLVGGPGAPGILVIKRDLVQNRVPFCTGGGTVFFVSEQGHTYHPVLEEREEGGTPNIVGSIRAGLAFMLKDTVGTDLIHTREEVFYKKAMATIKRLRNVELLGPGDSTKCLAIFSFNVRHGPFYLHYNFVSLLLNDLFGVQSRAGCSCAGPYVQRLLGMDEKTVAAYEALLKERLLGMDEKTVAAYEALLKEGHEMLRPGFVRLNFHFSFTDETVDFILKCIEFIAKEGWKLLPLYRYDPKTGVWRHKNFQSAFPVEPLSEQSYIYSTDGGVKSPYVPLTQSAKVLAKLDKERSLMYANGVHSAMDAVEEIKTDSSDFGVQGGLSGKADKMRWFMTPAEALDELRGDIIYEYEMPKFGEKQGVAGREREREGESERPIGGETA